MFARNSGASIPTIRSINRGEPRIRHFPYWDSNRNSIWTAENLSSESLDHCAAGENDFVPRYYNVCSSDEHTPQACLNKWTTDFDVASKISNYNDCFIRKVFDTTLSETHDYVIIYGGCDSQTRTLDAWYDYPLSVWEGTTFAFSPKSYKY